MPPWFWGWLATSIALTVVGLVARDWAAAAFAAGAVCATVAAGVGAPIWAQWTGFLVVSVPLLTLAVRRRYRPRHRRGAAGRPSPPQSR